MRKVRWTFNLPDFQGRYLKQGTSGTYGNESLPNITGLLNNILHNAGSAGGAFTQDTTIVGMTTAGQARSSSNFSFNASRSSSTYQNNAKVNPDNAEIMYVIKF